MYNCPNRLLLLLAVSRSSVVTSASRTFASSSVPISSSGVSAAAAASASFCMPSSSSVACVGWPGPCWRGTALLDADVAACSCASSSSSVACVGWPGPSRRGTALLDADVAACFCASWALAMLSDHATCRSNLCCKAGLSGYFAKISFSIRVLHSVLWALFAVPCLFASHPTQSGVYPNSVRKVSVILKSLTCLMRSSS